MICRRSNQMQMQHLPKQKIRRLLQDVPFPL
uniref:Uncharacterized protein n=1 Tax=Romanomermis culicivorax TaxID=13658 RepID=A0A915HFV7_ROMCU